MRAVALGLALGLGLGLTSCGGGSSSDGATSAAKFSEIYAQVFPAMTPAKCNFCHSQPASNISNGNLHTGAEGDIETAYAALVGTTSTSKNCKGQSAVVPGHPEQSLFYTKLTATPPCGARMPFGGGALPDAQIEMVRSWIAAGALDD